MQKYGVLNLPSQLPVHRAQLPYRPQTLLVRKVYQGMSPLLLRTMLERLSQSIRSGTVPSRALYVCTHVEKTSPGYHYPRVQAPHNCVFLVCPTSRHEDREIGGEHEVG
jgi:hypothetical protein